MEAINPTMEQRMEQEGALMVKRVTGLSITNDDDYSRGGVSVRTTWKARVTDPKKVPAYFDGYELREINMTALNGLARQYEGGMEIPGVEFYRDETLSVRA